MYFMSVDWDLPWACADIVKRVDAKMQEKTSVNELLRD